MEQPAYAVTKTPAPDIHLLHSLEFPPITFRSPHAPYNSYCQLPKIGIVIFTYALNRMLTTVTLYRKLTTHARSLKTMEIELILLTAGNHQFVS